MAGLLAVGSPALAGDADRGQLLILPEPAHMRPAFAEAIPGSDKTVFAPAIVRGDYVQFLNSDLMDRLKLRPESVRRVALRNASAELAALEPRYLRDPRGVVQAAIIDSDRPVAAATVFAPDFIERFEPVFGPDILVAIPNRYRIYIYPALASRFEDTADAVLFDFGLTPYAISTEVFRVRPEGLEAVGRFETE